MLIFDIETTGLRRDSDFLLAAFSDGTVTRSIKKTVKKLTQTLENGEGIVGHNCVSFDLPWMLAHPKVAGRHLGERFCEAIRQNPLCIIDTLHISKREYPHWLKGHGVEDWVSRLRHQYDYDIPDKPIDVDWTDIDEVRERCTHDVAIQTALWDYLWNVKAHKRSKTYRFLQYYYPLCIDSLSYGLPVNVKKLNRAKKELKLKTTTQAIKCKRLLDGANPGSAKQIQEFLLSKYKKGLPLTEKGNPSFSKDYREQLSAEFPEMGELFYLKELKQMLQFMKDSGEGKKNVFNKIYPSKVYGGHTIIPDLNVVGSRTLRSQYSNPPLNQFDKRLRTSIEAPEGWTLVGVDIKGLENAILSVTLRDVLGDESLDRDKCPKQMTLDIFGTLFDNVVCYGDQTLKDKAKTLNYAVLYGQGLKGTAKYLSLPEDNIPRIKSAMEERFPSLTRLHHTLKQSIFELRGQQHLKTMYSDVVPTPEYCVINTWCQTSGMVYAHMIFGLFYQELNKVKIEHYVSVVNHDEAQIMFKTTNERVLRKKIDRALERTYNKFFDVIGEELITTLEYKIGKNWKETH